MDAMRISRRDFGKLAMAAPAALRLAAASKIDGVEIGIISYSLRQIPHLDVDTIVKTMTQLGLSEVELMANHAEAAAGAPAQRQELRAWRTSGSMDRFQPVREKFAAAGIDLAVLCFNMNQAITDDEIDYAFQMAKALGARSISSSTQVSVSKRVAPFADKHKMTIGYHGHDNTSDPNEFATPESFAAAMSYSKYNGVNLDIGHFTAANYDAVQFIREHHDRITNLHLKDMKRNHGGYTVWGQGDAPIVAVLQLMKKEKYAFPGNIEYEYKGESDPATEVGKCLQYCKDALRA
jgi:sugar phosphate isomerase/epimerase